MTALNEDVIRQIVDYVPRDALQGIISASPIFLEAWMKSKYASVDIKKRDKRSKKLVARLSHPYVAQHVKSVSLRPWLVQPKTRSTRSLTENVFTRCMQVIDPHYSQKAAERRLQKRLHKDIERVTAALKKMSRLQEYVIDWNEGPVFHPEFYSAFLVPPLKEWSAHLTALSIHVPLPMISSLAVLHMKRLESFTYHICTGTASVKDINEQHDGLIVFIHNLKDSLQSLTLKSTSTSQHLDLSRMFRMMGTYPSLRHVSLSIPFDGGHLSDPMAFASFLTRHSSSLREFHLTTSRCAPHFKPGDPEHINWIQQILKACTPSLPLLTGVSLALRPLKAPLDTLAAFLEAHARTLREVELLDRPLDANELEYLFLTTDGMVAADDIRSLHLCLNKLSAALLASFAKRFQKLHTLKLECKEVDIVHDSMVLPYGRGVHNDTRSFLANIATYEDALSGWAVRHLAIGLREQPLLGYLRHDLERILPRVELTALPVH